MNKLYEPPAPDGPLFVYGLLKPGELAHRIIEEYVGGTSVGTVSGCLRLRDGLPLLDPSGPGHVLGHLLHFDPPQRQEGWRAIGDFVPDKHYSYTTAEVDISGEPVRANVLAGRRIGIGVGPEIVSSWSAVSDPAFVEGLAEVAALTIETAPDGVPSQPDGAEFWRVFFRLQAAYLMLWSIVERYTALRHGPALEPMRRLKRLGDEPGFRSAVVSVGAVGSSVIDVRDPDDKIVIRPNGDKASEYFYQIRSNLSHRGKSAFGMGSSSSGHSSSSMTRCDMSSRSKCPRSLRRGDAGKRKGGGFASVSPLPS